MSINQYGRYQCERYYENAIERMQSNRRDRTEGASMRSAKRTNKILVMVLSVLVACSTLALGGCSGVTGSKEIDLEPVVSSPAVGTDGVLKVGVNSTNIPYSGLSDNNLVGIDVDVAAAIAEELGLRLELVDIADQSADTLLEDGTVDMVMGVEQTTDKTVIQGTQVGPYIESGPAIFAIAEGDTIPPIELDSITGGSVAVQKDSLSARSVDGLIASGTSDPKDSLADAFAAVESGQNAYAAADAVVGSYYLASNNSNLVCAKMLGTPIGVHMGVTKTNSQLADALTDALRNLRDTGRLKIIFSKWLGPLSASVVMGSSGITSSEITGATDATETELDEVVDTGDDLPDASNAGGV